MNLITTLLLICLSQNTNAPSIHATWTAESKDGSPIILVLMEDNQMLVKFGEDDAMFGPFYGYGSYTFDGTTLSMQMSTGEQYQYEISKLRKKGFQMRDTETGEIWEYRYQSKATVPTWGTTHLATELSTKE